MKYYLTTYETFIRNWKDVKPGCTDFLDNDPVAEQVFDNPEDAKRILRGMPTTVKRFRDGNKEGYLVTETWLWEDDGTYRGSLDCSDMANFILDQHGIPTDYDEAFDQMDPDVLDSLPDDLTPCSDQDFYDAYCEAHYEHFETEFDVL